MFDSFPVALLNRSIFVLSHFDNPHSAAKLGWRAPVFAYVGLQPKSAVPGTEFVYGASLLDVTGTIRARQELKLRPDAVRQMSADATAEWARAGGSVWPVASGGRAVPWEGALEGLHFLERDDLAAVRSSLVRRRDGSNGRAAFSAVCEILDRTGSESCQVFLEALERDRFTASAWFERDRSQLSLRDEVLDCDVVSLWDAEVHDELQSGFLTAPTRPRPSDSDWLPHLVAFAQERNLITPLRGEQSRPSPERNRP